MPTYEYACRSCGEHLEVVQKFSDDALTDCPACGGALRKVFGSVGIVLKGSGFYKTDSRGSSSSSTSPATSDTASTGNGSTKTSSSESSGTATGAGGNASGGSGSTTPASSSGSAAAG